MFDTLWQYIPHSLYPYTSSYESAELLQSFSCILFVMRKDGFTQHLSIEVGHTKNKTQFSFSRNYILLYFLYIFCILLYFMHCIISFSIMYSISSLYQTVLYTVPYLLHALCAYIRYHRFHDIVQYRTFMYHTLCRLYHTIYNTVHYHSMS